MSGSKWLSILSPSVLLAALGVTLLLSATGETADAAQYTVNIRDFSFNPSTLNIQVGDVVRWENGGAATHTASSETGIWDSGSLAPGGVFSQQFLTPGTFAYFCRIHPQQMRGSIVVQAPAATATQAPPTATVPPEATPVPPPPAVTVVVEEVPVPVPAPTLVPAPPRVPELWFQVLEPTPAYSSTDEVLWIAAPGEWYRVLDQDAGWALALWEFDPPDALVWIELDGRVELGAF